MAAPRQPSPREAYAMKPFSALVFVLFCALALLASPASAEVLYDREGIQLQGTARIVSRNAATCNVLEEKYSPEEYEKLKANQGRPLHVWQLDMSVHNNTGKPLDFLSADFNIESPWPPCTNWSGEGPGGGRCPVERVSWMDVQAFIGRLNARSGGERYRLPTEAEWEYAARAGTTTDTYAGDVAVPMGNDPVVNGIAWYDENSGGRTHPVGQKAPNGFGLHDMLGNVWEWVGDWGGRYPGGTVTDPAGPGSGSIRVNRGGGWNISARNCRSASRSRNSPGNRSNNLGFRLLRTE